MMEVIPDFSMPFTLIGYLRQNSFVYHLATMRNVLCITAHMRSSQATGAKGLMSCLLFITVHLPNLGKRRRKRDVSERPMDRSSFPAVTLHQSKKPDVGSLSFYGTRNMREAPIFSGARRQVQSTRNTAR